MPLLQRNYLQGRRPIRKTEPLQFQFMITNHANLENKPRSRGSPARTERRGLRFSLLIIVIIFCVRLAFAGTMSGSGFVIRQDGLIVTNYHVIKNATSITVTVPGCKPVSARVLLTDQEKDLAILQVPLRNLTALPIASSSTVQVLDSITILGYPLPTELGTALSASDGKVNALRDGQNGSGHLLQIDANVNPGNSGGPVLNNHGEVVGIVVAKINSLQYAKENGALPERINFAIPTDEARELIKRVYSDFAPSHRQQVLTEQEVYQSAKNSTVLIVADQDENGGGVTYTVHQGNDDLNDFVSAFVQAGTTGSRVGQVQYFASPCDYFENGQCNRQSIAQELEYYNQKWPWRKYQLLATPVVNVTNQGSYYQVSFKVAFTLRNHEKTVSGICYYQTEVVKSGNGFLITSIRERFSSGDNQGNDTASR